MTVRWVDSTKACRASLQRGVPLAEIDDVGKFQSDLLLVVRGLAIQAKGLQHLMRVIENGAARGFVNAAGFHAHQPVFDRYRAIPMPFFAAQFIELFDDLHAAQLLAVNGGGDSLLKVNFHIGRGIGSLFGDTPISKISLYFGSFSGFSRSRPSWDKCHRFLSLE